MRQSFFLLLIMGFIAISCNKNSNELPPLQPLPSQDTLTNAIKLIDVNNNNSEVLRAQYVRKAVNGHNIIDVTLSNRTGLDIDNLRLLFEQCKGNESFDNCNLQKVIGPMTLRSSADTTLRLFDNEPVSLTNKTDSTFSVHIVSYKNNSFPYSGAYAAEANYSTYIIHDSLANSKNYSGWAQGFIQADGQSVFTLKIDNLRYMNIHGRFDANNTFRGNLIMLPNMEIIPLKVDSISLSSGNTIIDSTGGNLHLRFKPFEMLSDSVSFIELHLFKN